MILGFILFSTLLIVVTTAVMLLLVRDIGKQYKFSDDSHVDAAAIEARIAQLKREDGDNG